MWGDKQTIVCSQKKGLAGAHHDGTMISDLLSRGQWETIFSWLEAAQFIAFCFSRPPWIYTNHQSLFLSSRCHQRSVGMKEIKWVFEKKIQKPNSKPRWLHLQLFVMRGNILILYNFFFFYRKFLFVLFLRQYLKYPRLACSWGWPWPAAPLVSTSPVLQL